MPEWRKTVFQEDLPMYHTYSNEYSLLRNPEGGCSDRQDCFRSHIMESWSMIRVPSSMTSGPVTQVKSVAERVEKAPSA